MYKKYFDDEEGLSTYKYVFQEDDNTFLELTMFNDSRNITVGGIDNMGEYCFITIKIIKYVLDDKKEKHALLEICKKFNLTKTNASLSIAFYGNENPDYYYNKIVDKNDVTKYSFKFLINGKYKTITTTSSEKELSKSLKNKIQQLIEDNIKNKWSKNDDFFVLCKSSVEVNGYMVNGGFYETLEEAAEELKVSISFLYNVLNKKCYSSDFNVYRDLITKYCEEKHRLSDVIFKMDDFLLDETFDLMSKDWLENNFLK